MRLALIRVRSLIRLARERVGSQVMRRALSGNLSRRVQGRMPPTRACQSPSCLLALLWLTVAAPPPLVAQTPTYQRAALDSAGQLHIWTTTGQQVAPPLDSGQVGFDQPHIAQDGAAVGWLALYPNCCTSYPIPLRLVVLAGGKQVLYSGSGLPIWRWTFLAGGTQVAFYQETVHGGGGQHYELRDLASSRLLAVFDPGDSLPPPAWVRTLDARR